MVITLGFKEDTAHPEAGQITVYSKRMADKVTKTLESNGFKVTDRIERER